jgi:hypothetical protein
MSIKQFFEVNDDEKCSGDENREYEKLLVGKYNLFYLYFKKQKNSYRLFIKSGRRLQLIKFKLRNVLCPFGIETFNNKKIVNLEFCNYQKDNNSYNNYIFFKRIDEIFSKFSRGRDYLKKFRNIGIYSDINEKVLNATYKSSIREKKSDEKGDYDPLFRVYLRKVRNKVVTKFYVRKDGEHFQVPPLEIKSRKVEVELELSNMWIREGMYGLIWVINSIVIL